MREIKVAIEDVTQCPGRCDGCLLSAKERSGLENSVKFDWDHLSRFVTAFHDYRGPSNRLVLNFGQGDHSALSDVELRKRDVFLKSVGTSDYEAFFTIAAAVKGDKFHSNVLRMGEILSDHAGKIGIDLVFDPTYYENKKFWTAYSKNIEHVYSVFGRVDLNVNIGPDTVSSCSALEFDEFVSGNLFSNVTINFVPTKHTGYLHASSSIDVFNWIADLVDVKNKRQSRYGLTFEDVMKTIFADYSGLRGLEIADPLISSLMDQVYVDGSGDIYFTQSMIGDYPLSDRTGYSSIGNISSFNLDHLEPNATTVFRGLYRRFLSRPSCSKCKWASLCMFGGQVAAGGVLADFRDRNDECPTRVDILWPTINPNSNFNRSAVDEVPWSGSGVSW